MTSCLNWLELYMALIDQWTSQIKVSIECKLCNALVCQIMFFRTHWNTLNCDMLVPKFSFSSLFCDADVNELTRRTWRTKATKTLHKEKNKHIYQKINSNIPLSQDMSASFGSTYLSTNPLVWTFRSPSVLVFLMLHICTLVSQKQCAKTQRFLLSNFWAIF